MSLEKRIKYMRACLDAAKRDPYTLEGERLLAAFRTIIPEVSFSEWARSEPEETVAVNNDAALAALAAMPGVKITPVEKVETVADGEELSQAHLDELRDEAAKNMVNRKVGS